MRLSTSAIRSQWREGKVRPLPGNSPHDRPVSRGVLSRSGEFATIPSRHFHSAVLPSGRHPVCVFQAWRNLSARCVSKPEPTQT
jgi:hypothetical protein